VLPHGLQTLEFTAYVKITISPNPLTAFVVKTVTIVSFGVRKDWKLEDKKWLSPANKSGRAGIRTLGEDWPHSGFQDRCIKPLCHPSGSLEDAIVAEVRGFYQSVKLRNLEVGICS
jgi:hypothetical protein